MNRKCTFKGVKSSLKRAIVWRRVALSEKASLLNPTFLNMDSLEPSALKIGVRE